MASIQQMCIIARKLHIKSEQLFHVTSSTSQHVNEIMFVVIHISFWRNLSRDSSRASHVFVGKKIKKLYDINKIK